DVFNEGEVCALHARVRFGGVIGDVCGGGIALAACVSSNTVEEVVAVFGANSQAEDFRDLAVLVVGAVCVTVSREPNNVTDGVAGEDFVVGVFSRFITHFPESTFDPLHRLSLGSRAGAVGVFGVSSFIGVVDQVNEVVVDVVVG